MSIRDKPTYLSHDVWRALWILARSENNGTEGTDHLKTTPDEIADKILRQVINEQHPQLFEHQARIDKLEKELIASLSKK